MVWPWCVSHLEHGRAWNMHLTTPCIRGHRHDAEQIEQASQGLQALQAAARQGEGAVLVRSSARALLLGLAC